MIISLTVIALGALLTYSWRAHVRHEEQRLLHYGNVEIREVNLGFRVAGKVEELLKDEGDAVKTGELREGGRSPAR